MGEKTRTTYALVVSHVRFDVFFVRARAHARRLGCRRQKIIFSIRRTSRREKKCRLSIIIIDSPDDDDDGEPKQKSEFDDRELDGVRGEPRTDGESRRRHRRLDFGEEVRWLLLRHVWLFRLFHAHAGQRAVMVRLD